MWKGKKEGREYPTSCETPTTGPASFLPSSLPTFIHFAMGFPTYLFWAIYLNWKASIGVHTLDIKLMPRLPSGLPIGLGIVYLSGCNE